MNFDILKAILLSFKQWRSQEGAPGSIAPQTAVLPKQIHMKKILTSFATNVPQNVTIGGINQNKNSARFARSIGVHTVPHFHISGTVSDCDG